MALQHPNMTVAHRQLTAKERQILEKQVLVHVGIVLPDGTPHVSAMWVGLDGEDIILNTAEGRTKANVLRLGSAVALSVLDPENPTATSACAAAWSRSLVKSGALEQGSTALPRSISEWRNTRIAPRESDACSSGCGPRSSAVGAKTNLSGFADFGGQYSIDRVDGHCSGPKPISSRSYSGLYCSFAVGADANVV